MVHYSLKPFIPAIIWLDVYKLCCIFGELIIHS